MSDQPISGAQLEANRENAKKSTGPRSAEGRKRSSGNSVKHGLTGGPALLPSDDRDAYDEFVAGIVDSLYPGSPLEHQIARNVADAHWRLRRISSVECRMLTLPAVVPASDEPPSRTREQDLQTAARVCLDAPNALTNIALYEQRIHRNIKNSMEELRRLRAERQEKHQREMPAAMDRYKERRMQNIPFDLEADGFVFSFEEVHAAIRAESREKLVAAAKKCNFDLAEFQKLLQPKAA